MQQKQQETQMCHELETALFTTDMSVLHKDLIHGNNIKMSHCDVLNAFLLILEEFLPEYNNVKL